MHAAHTPAIVANNAKLPAPEAAIRPASDAAITASVVQEALTTNRRTARFRTWSQWSPATIPQAAGTQRGPPAAARPAEASNTTMLALIAVSSPKIVTLWLAAMASPNRMARAPVLA